VVLGALALAIQLVPYGWRHPNPPVVDDAPWPSAETRDLAVRACYDCHSNETRWPVYSYVAPMSWLVRRDVETGRDAFNFSNWEDDDNEADDAVEEIVEGSMPPTRYTLIHRDANLDDAEMAALIDALEQLGDGGGDGDNSGPGSDNSGPGGGD
jgi:Haem-binding domain